MTAPGLHHEPGQGGLYRHLIADGRIDHNRWMRACAEHGHVGECRHCSSYLRPERPQQHNGRTDYEAVCINDTCSCSVSAPAGRVLARSTRHSEMPGGWWEHRNRALKQEGAA